MKSFGEGFEISNFYADDIAMHERGENRVGNLLIRNESYMKFEDLVVNYLEKVYEKKKRISTSELLKEIGLMLEDENSILYQAAKMIFLFIVLGLLILLLDFSCLCFSKNILILLLILF